MGSAEVWVMETSPQSTALEQQAASARKGPEQGRRMDNVSSGSMVPWGTPLCTCLQRAPTHEPKNQPPHTLEGRGSPDRELTPSRPQTHLCLGSSFHSRAHLERRAEGPTLRVPGSGPILPALPGEVGHAGKSGIKGSHTVPSGSGTTPAAGSERDFKCNELLIL